MIKRVIFFILFLKTYENNSYLFSKNYFLFHFIFKNYFEKISQIILENFKNSFLFLKTNNSF